jgi:o-succinylbenzoate synthase
LTVLPRYNAIVKIFSLKAEPWDVPMRSAYRSAQRVTTTAHNVLVTVTLEDGTIGYGESAPAYYVTGETQESVWQWVHDFAPRLRNRPYEEVEGLIPEAGEVMPGAVGALETAILDARARSAKLPFYRLLDADANTPTSRATDISLPILSPEEAGTRAEAAVRDGFRAIKIKVGCGDLAEDEARVRAIADASPDISLRLDGNQGFSPEEAVRFMESLSDLVPRIELLEQPTKAGNDAAMGFVSERVSVPVFADESVHHAEDARRLVEGGICSGVVLKLAKSGLSETAKIAAAVRNAGGTCLFGCMMETHIATGAALHLALALGEETVPLLDLDGHLLVNDRDVLTGGFTQQGDVLQVNAAELGLGVKLLPHRS